MCRYLDQSDECQKLWSIYANIIILISNHKWYKFLEFSVTNVDNADLIFSIVNILIRKYNVIIQGSYEY